MSQPVGRVVANRGYHMRTMLYAFSKNFAEKLIKHLHWLMNDIIEEAIES